MKCPHCHKSIGRLHPVVRVNRKDRRCPFCDKGIEIYIEYRLFCIYGLSAFVVLLAASPHIRIPVVGQTITEGMIAALVFAPVLFLSFRLRPVKERRKG